MPLLIQYTEAAALAENAVRTIHQEPRAMAIWKEATKTMVALCARLRICPQSRQPNNPKRPERMSYYEREALGLEDGDDAQQGR